MVNFGWLKLGEPWTTRQIRQTFPLYSIIFSIIILGERLRIKTCTLTSIYSTKHKNSIYVAWALMQHTHKITKIFHEWHKIFKEGNVRNFCKV